MRGKEPSLVEKFEDLLLAEPEITRTGPGDGHSLEREQQLQQFISRKLAEKKPVTVKFGDKSIEVREQFDHIIARLSVLKPLGNSLAAIDPVHAGLPWAGVCLLLSVSNCINPWKPFYQFP